MIELRLVSDYSQSNSFAKADSREFFANTKLLTICLVLRRISHPNIRSQKGEL